MKKQVSSVIVTQDFVKDLDAFIFSTTGVKPDDLGVKGRALTRVFVLVTLAQQMMKALCDKVSKGE